MAIDHFGITAPGESWKAIEEGRIDIDSDIPINPSGGLIGAGHPVRATGVRQLLDAHKRVTGTAATPDRGAKNFQTLYQGSGGSLRLRCRRRQVGASIANLRHYADGAGLRASSICVFGHGRAMVAAWYVDGF
ncbi:MAG: hypothetical protein R2706_02885 [Acidimicrobiales bacterium]